MRGFTLSARALTIFSDPTSLAIFNTWRVFLGGENTIAKIKTPSSSAVLYCNYCTVLYTISLQMSTFHTDLRRRTGGSPASISEYGWTRCADSNDASETVCCDTRACAFRIFAPFPRPWAFHILAPFSCLSQHPSYVSSEGASTVPLRARMCLLGFNICIYEIPSLVPWLAQTKTKPQR